MSQIDQIKTLAQIQRPDLILDDTQIVIIMAKYLSMMRARITQKQDAEFLTADNQIRWQLYTEMSTAIYELTKEMIINQTA